MTSSLGSLGTPRIAIALIWFLDGGARPQGEPAGAATPPAASSPPAAPPVAAPVTPEDIELVRGLTGLAPEELVTRLQDIAAAYARDPGALRAEILRVTGGNEIAAGHLMQLIHASTPGDDSSDSSADTERAGTEEGRAPGRVIDLSQHVPNHDDANGDANGDDDGGNP